MAVRGTVYIRLKIFIIKQSAHMYEITKEDYTGAAGLLGNTCLLYSFAQIEDKLRVNTVHF